jgi:hypothetical protein
MIRRAILWCGDVRSPISEHDTWGIKRSAKDQRREDPDPLHYTDDFRIQANGLDLAFRAARELGVPPDEIYACLLREDLAPQELRTEVAMATVPGLRGVVSQIARRFSSEDALLFVAVNHGYMRADGGAPEVELATADRVDQFGDPAQSRLTPEVLDDCLRPLAGPQVLVIATCFAGGFLPLARDHRAVVAACGATEKHRVSRADGTCSAFLDELFGAWSGVAHSDAVPVARLPLDAAFARAKERLLTTPSLNVPEYAGTNVWPG